MQEKKIRYGLASEPEMKKTGGTVELRPGIRLGFTKCFTCNNMCGIRYRYDEREGRLTRVAGNPYCEVVTGGRPLPLSTPVRKAYEMLTGDSGLSHRATTCGKGASGPDVLSDPYRIVKVLKRAGKRGENKWHSIPYEQALREILEGGDLFGEGSVEGLRSIRDLKTPVKPGSPEFGSKANQLFATFNEEDTIRGGLFSRFVTKGFGSVNLVSKHAYCGSSVGIGYSLGLDPTIGAGMCDIDWNEFEYGIFIGTAPGSSGASLNRLGFGAADARTARKAEYVCVDPILRNPAAAETGASWLPIIPGGDCAFLYALVRVIIDRKWYNADFLRVPSKSAAAKAKEVNWSNAAWLVNVESGSMADAAEFGLGKKGEGIVLVGGRAVSSEKAILGDLDAQVTLKALSGKSVRLATSFAFLKREAQKHSLADYSRLCGIPAEKITAVAEKFTHHGRKAAVVSNTGNYTADAPMVGWLICILNTLIGSHDARGGAIYGNGAQMGFEGRYDLNTVSGAPKLDGQSTVCLNMPYEESTEFKQKAAKGLKPYPAGHLYHNMNPGYGASNAAEMLTALANKSPYPAKALLTWRSNPVYAAASFSRQAVRALADPRTLPLFVSIDAYINETNVYADYIIPDHVMYEDYACDRTWGSFDQCVVAGAPVSESRTVKDAQGRRVGMERFLIDCAVKLGLPGFGRSSIPVKDGSPVDLLDPEDWSVRYIANVAAQCKGLPQVTDEDRKYAGLVHAMRDVTARVTKGEASQIEALFSRGGYYAHEERYDGQFMKNGGGKFLQLFNPAMAALHNCYSGKKYPGVPVLDEPRFFNGDPWSKIWGSQRFPLRFSSYKPILRSPYSAAFEHDLRVSPQNFIFINKTTAARLGLKDGDKARLVSPNGLSAEGVLKCVQGVAAGAVCVSHCFGHTGYGARDCLIDGQTIRADARRGSGIAVNRLIPQDPTWPGPASLLCDVWAGGNCRSGIPMRVEKA